MHDRPIFHEQNEELLAEMDAILDGVLARIRHKDRPDFPPHSTRIGRPRYFTNGRVFGG